MAKRPPVISPATQASEETPLRESDLHCPLTEFIGQSAIVSDLRAKLATCAQRGTSLPHLLVCGPPNMGKATLARALALELSGSEEEVSDSIDNRGALAALLTTKVQRRSGLVLRDVDLLRPAIAKELASALDTWVFSIRTGDGAFASDVDIPLQEFTVIATTSRPSQLNRVLRPWFVRYDLVPYSDDEIAAVLAREAPHVQTDALQEVARRSQGCPGDARVLLRRVTNWLAGAELTLQSTRDSLATLGLGRAEDAATSDAARVQTMTGDEFEEFVASLYWKLGYAVETTGQSGDHGVDLLMRKDGKLVVVQCKRWDGAVGEPVLRDLFGAMTSAQAERAILVTTGFFTASAFAFAEGKHIELVDGDGLRGLISRARAAGERSP
jgi:Holliday junction resolvasome RuvABC ATP-dependent DNA helicase subunit